MKYLGQAPLVNEFEYHLDDEDCTEFSSPGDGTFQFAQITFLVAPASPADPLGRIRDLELQYFPGKTSETWGYNCVYGSSFGPVTSGLWTGAYLTAHEEEFDFEGEGGFIATGWEIFIRRGDYFAKKEWQMDLPDLEILEVGTFKLYHRPGS
jgi:hypothetical protein